MPRRSFTPRTLLRLLRLGWVIGSGMSALPLFLLRGRDAVSARIAWMQWMSRRFLSLLHCRVELSGNVPSEGLVAANHLGYVDILVLGSVCPAVFVAKGDVDGWPVFGWLARNAGTIFVSRDNPAEVPAQLRRMEIPLRTGHPVILFPEGTSSDGSSVLPFRSSLLESAVRTGARVTPASLSYDLHGAGIPGDEVAYWGDHTLMPHLVNLFSKPRFTARLTFGATRAPEVDRKRESVRLQSEVRGMLGV